MRSSGRATFASGFIFYFLDEILDQVDVLFREAVAIRFFRGSDYIFRHLAVHFNQNIGHDREVASNRQLIAKQQLVGFFVLPYFLVISFIQAFDAVFNIHQKLADNRMQMKRAVIFNLDCFLAHESSKS